MVFGLPQLHDENREGRTALEMSELSCTLWVDSP